MDSTIKDIKNTLISIFNDDVNNWHEISGITITNYDRLADSIRLSTYSIEEDDDNIDYIMEISKLSKYLKYLVSNNTKNTVCIILEAQQ